MTKRTRIWIGVTAILLIAGLALWQYISFRWHVACCAAQHTEALSRQIGVEMVDQAMERDRVVVVPATAPYAAYETWPMNYRLVLRTGYRFELGKEPRADSVIAYFLAEPTYPFLVRMLGIEPRMIELLVLNADLSVRARPKEERPEW
jgi:hypothetical protein